MLKIFPRLLILANFLIIIFYASKLSILGYLCLCTIMCLSVVYYWFASYWISKKKLVQILGKDPNWEVFTGKVPANVTDDLTRGRLVIDNGKLLLYTKNIEKDRKENPWPIKWSANVEDITSLSFGKVAGARKGVMFNFGDDYVAFCSVKVTKEKEKLYQALGWDIK
ncbi:MAG: hypothetical protein HUK24_07255 [Sphaerochaetaceae bacterium]|nr:hypothetical protein [Sphaerochaetaceae bacterium]